MTDTTNDLRTGQSWQQLLAQRSFIELDALARATALADNGALRVLAGPFDRLESPWLAPQGIRASRRRRRDRARVPGRRHR